MSVMSGNIYHWWNTKWNKINEFYDSNVVSANVKSSFAYDFQFLINWSSGIPPDGDTMFTLTATALTPCLQDRMYLANKSFFLQFLNEVSNNIFIDID